MRKCILLLITFFLLLWAPPLQAACTTCHSKRPEIVKMHDELALTGQSCFACHGPANKLKGKKMPVSPKEIRAEPLCVPCHDK